MSLEPNHRTDAQSVVRDISLGDGGIIIYDTENEAAWIQADSPDIL
ncbi:MAG: hypothetical protein ACI8UR_000760 [Natronomonas sp.]|jgi:hypothetical protein